MNFRLVRVSVCTPDQIIPDTSLRIVDGMIAEIGGSSKPGDHDIDGVHGIVVPGAVDLHCDALEKIVESRPGVSMPQPHIMPQADRLYAAAGITTIYHAVSFADRELGVRSLARASEISHDIKEWQPYGAIDHRLHTRYEVCDAGGLPVLQALIEAGVIDLLSVMDHSPGQGQFQTFEAFFAFYGRSYDLNEAEARALADAKRSASAEGWERAVTLIGEARSAGIPIASHDDDSPQRVQFIAELGGTISEFPVNLATARYAHEAGLATIMGAPNIIRGSSQSGNMRALDAVHAGVLDCLCADYVPWSLLAAAFHLPSCSQLDLPAAMHLVSTRPAVAAGLSDRGAIVPGLRADLVLVGQVRNTPQVLTTWSGGRIAYRCEPPRLAVTSWMPSAAQAATPTPVGS